MKILIAIPTFENIYPDTFKSVYDLDKCGHDCVFEFIRGYDCAYARNLIANRAKEIGADYLLMLDSDIVLPKEALKWFLEDPKDVCIGFTARRNTENKYDGITATYKLGEFDYVTRYTCQEVKEMQERGEYKVHVHGGGMGSALIKTDVFNRIDYPYYQWRDYHNGVVLSEDLHFCEMCKGAGIDIYADTRVTNGHIFRYLQEVF